MYPVSPTRSISGGGPRSEDEGSLSDDAMDVAGMERMSQGSTAPTTIDDTPFQYSHKDVITHISLDITGRRMATCSTDKTMAVWDRDETGRWNRTACWKVHGGVVWRSVWAHGEFGQVLATCSSDRNVHIWEEIHVEGSRHGKWIRKACLTDSRNGVTDIAFAPRHLGLMLATVSVQGVVRVYEAADVMDLSRWSMIHELQAFHTRCGCVAWSQSPIHRPLLVVGSDDQKAKRDERIVVYELNDALRKFQRMVSLRMDLPSPVTDLRFSPILSDQTHQIAIAAGDVFIYNFKVPAHAFLDDDESIEPTTTATEYTPVKISQLGVGDVKKAWRVRFNLTGNVLIVASGDGTVRIWKSIFVDQWAQLTQIEYQQYIDEDDHIPLMGRGFPSEERKVLSVINDLEPFY